MAFKKADLENWNVKREIEIVAGSKLTLSIAVVDGDRLDDILASESDAHTAQELLVGIDGYVDNDGNAASLSQWWDEAGKYPAIQHKIAVECINAQHDALLKN